MAKFSMKQDGKEVGGASVYAQPHNMSGKAVGISSTPGKETVVNKSVFDTRIKTDGIKIRGTGAATRGVTARGPMA
jgi:hypothetical protein